MTKAGAAVHLRDSTVSGWACVSLCNACMHACVSGYGGGLFGRVRAQEVADTRYKLVAIRISRGATYCGFR